MTRAQCIISSIREAREAPSNLYDVPPIQNYDDLLHHVAHLVWQNPRDARPPKLLYAYFVAVGSERMEPTLQELGHLLMQKYGTHFEETQEFLNHVVKRISAIGRMRHKQQQRGDKTY